MKKNIVAVGTYTSAQTGKTYAYDLERQTRTDYREFMNPATRYERVYFQVNVYEDGAWRLFGFVDDAEDGMAVHEEVKKVVHKIENPLTEAQLAVMHSRFD
jgi:hypothetical protein